ncbi:Protein RDR1 [Neonectria ditissima]|uniref:Protein RDR1 n=1 Tax=Neonectria ditissima TaxID=78410 RepID=A0A0P7AVH2_9HYPO|nr:Protein RDR1 [Neonectria ditissima]
MSALLGRQRAKLACASCRGLKRKCDGAQPCGTCVRFEYECIYSETSSSKKRKRSERDSDSSPQTQAQSSPQPPRSEIETPTANSDNHIRSLEANSAPAFLRRLALRLDPKNAPRMHTFAWNAFLGARKTGHSPVCRAITDMLSRNEMQRLAAIYFEKVDPIYGFVDRQDVERLIRDVWAGGSHGPFQDAVLCGIAALGYLYSQVQSVAVELDLVETARTILEKAMSDTPTVPSITAWVLRVVYLRVAATHHTAWMASCILMHMVEAAGLHCEPSSESILPSAEDVDSELRRRLVAVAQHLNIWMSFDMGRSRVALCNATVIMPSARPGDHTVELMELLPYSAGLDPEKTPNISELEAALSAVLNRVHSSPPSTMAQCNLALCLCRRLQSMNASLTGTMLEQMLSLTSKGIQASQSILDARAPWHHMANVPLQIVCVLLAIDASSTMSQLRGAMQCLSNVAAVYATDATQEALKTASLLILLHQRWKEKCASDLGDILKLYPMVRLHETKDDYSVEQMENIMWLDNLAGDLSSLQYADIDQLLIPGLFCDGSSNQTVDMS